MESCRQPYRLAHPLEEVPVILRRIGAIVAVGALILLSVASGAKVAYAAPNPPTVDQTFPDPWITNETQPSFLQGNKDVGVTHIDVEISQDGSNYTPYCSESQIPGATTWSCNAPTGSLALGINYVRAIATDAVPEVSAPGPAITITVVNTPAIISPADGSITNNNQPTFTGATDGSSFTVESTFPTTAPLCTGTVVSQLWNCTPGPLADGYYEFRVQVNFGASSVYSTTSSFTIDTVLTPPNTSINGPSPLVTTVETPTVTGTAEPFATITMWKDYLTEIFCAGGAPVADAGGAWVCTFAAPLTATGIFTISSQQTDVAGNTNIGMSPDPQLQLNYTDVTPPAPPVVTSPIGATITESMNVVVTNNTTATVTGTGEPGATLNMFGNNCIVWPTLVDSGGNWTCQLVTPMTPDGDFDVFFGQQDAAFNSSSLASPGLRFTVDTVAPAAPTVTSPTGPFVEGVFRVTTANRQPLITGSAEDGATVRIYRGESIPVPCLESPLVAGPSGFACHVASPLPYGTSTLSFAQTDVAGNPSDPAVARLKLIIPIPPPPPTPVAVPILGASWLLHFSTSAEDAKPGQEVTLTGSNLPPGSTVSAELHSTPTPLGTTIVKDDGTFVLSAIIPLTVEPGPHHYVVTVAPLDGAPQTAEVPVTVLFVPAPVAESSTPTVKTPAGTTASGREESPPIPRNAPAAPNSLSQTLPTFFDVIANPLVVAAAAASSLALLFLVAFPAEILNSTLDENYERIFGKLPKMRFPWFARLRDRLKRAPALGGLALTTLAALIFSFADPHFGFDLASLRLFLACAIGMLVLGFVANEVTSLILRRRWSITSVIELQPLGLVVALVGVILSRVLDFAPGLLIGLVLGLSLSAGASAKDEVRAVLVWVGVVLGLAITSWLVYSFGSLGSEPGNFAIALFDDSVVAIATEGISGLVIGLLPIGLLDGRTVFHHSRRLWLCTYTAVLISFFVIVVPSGALWGDIDGNFWIWLTVLLVFAAVCVSVYLWFKAHPEREELVDVGHGESADEIVAQVRGGRSPLK